MDSDENGTRAYFDQMHSKMINDKRDGYFIQIRTREKS